MAKKKVTKKAPEKDIHPGGRVYTWNNGGRQQAIHESGIMLAQASPPFDLKVPKSFFALDGTPILVKDCGIEAVLDEELGEHVGLDNALQALAQAQQDAPPDAGPTITMGEVSSLG